MHRSLRCSLRPFTTKVVNVQASRARLVELEEPSAQIKKPAHGRFILFGTEGRNRTGTPLLARDFESRASTSSATPAINL